MRASFALLIAGTILAAGCQRTQPPAAAPAKAAGGAESSTNTEPTASREVTIFAAASTQDALETIVDQFKASNPGVDLQCSFASSSTLAEQIAGGAPADLFLSANRQWAEYLVQRKLVADQQDLLGNQLIVVVAADSKLQITKPTDLAGDGVEHLALGDPESVPAGIYAKQALTKLELWETLKDKVVSGNDVRQALAYVETGAAEAGIVYATDAAVSKKVKVAFPFDTDLTEPIVYPLVLLKSGAENAPARDFYHYLPSPGAAAIFRQAGFRVRQAAGVQ